MRPPQRRMRLRPIHRDRHGRGRRGPLAPRDSVLAQARAEEFDDLVRLTIERLERRWESELAKVEFAIEDVPSLDDWDDDWIPLARAFAKTGALPPRVVVYKRPISTRAANLAALRALIGDVVAEQVAELLALSPQEVDPSYGRSEP